MSARTVVVPSTSECRKGKYGTQRVLFCQKHKPGKIRCADHKTVVASAKILIFVIKPRPENVTRYCFDCTLVATMDRSNFWSRRESRQVTEVVQACWYLGLRVLLVAMLYTKN